MMRVPGARPYRTVPTTRGSSSNETRPSASVLGTTSKKKDTCGPFRIPGARALRKARCTRAQRALLRPPLKKQRQQLREIGGLTVIKAQVKTGGRGKAGGVKLAKSPKKLTSTLKAILGMDIKGHTVHRVLVADGADIAEEYYFSLLLDRANRSYLAMLGRRRYGSEQLAAERPRHWQRSRLTRWSAWTRLRLRGNC